jgi:hypothetical protein
VGGEVGFGSGHFGGVAVMVGVLGGGVVSGC